ncbi:MAG: acetyl-CoA carboxylase biotin carboxylase subunit [Deltaproteobacteria bacterium]|nr:acetyl-CoA carboxylase biotin carboxylase subunit [Deltaproteobacteria bacterium]
MFDRILIANRGEIALRVVRAARELGMTTVAVHSTADAESPHVRFADDSVCIGPPAARDSYLNVPALIAAAEISGAQAVHPGYGFLSENAEFAEVCGSCGLTWIGPSPEMIRLMGNKVEARRAMAEAGLPLLPGSPGPVADAKEAEALARELGLPVILKASAGGGGRGMKIVRDLDHVAQAFEMASAEAEAAFSNGEMFLERYVEAPRHIEIQIIADAYGNIIHLGERECSVQRRHQKLLEESPSPAVSKALRDEMGNAAVEALRKVGYTSVGTVEFLLDEQNRYYFMETNTRIQVEHPVTELVTGFDLVREQIRLAAGEKLGRSQEDIIFRGHAIEARINAEDPVTFAPSPGLITGYHAPGGFGVRVDSTIYEQYRVLPYYDSLLAKLIVYAENRKTALARLDRALGEMVIEGISTNIPFHRRLLKNESFRAGNYDTRIVPQILED